MRRFDPKRRIFGTNTLSGWMANPANHTKLLLHADGTNASTSFPDASPSAKTVTANGNAQVSTAQSKFGGASALFDGTGDYLSIPDSADWDFGIGDLTLECWVRFNTVKKSAFIMVGTQFSEGVGLAYSSVSGNLIFWDAGSQVNPQAWSPSTATWYHLAAVRQATGDGKVHTYVDGTEIGTGTANTSRVSVTSGTRIGNDAGDSAYDMDGWIDEIRISNVARWLANFTPATVAYGG